MKKLLSRGFTAIEVLLVVVLVGLVAGVGYYVYNQSQKKDDASQPQSNVSGTTDKTKADEDAQKYLVITELGVKMPLTEGITDAYYIIKPELPNVAYLSLNSIKDTEMCAADEVSMGALSKLVASEIDEQSGMTHAAMAEQSGKVIGTTAYLFTSPQASCSDMGVGSPTDTKQTAAIAAFKAAAKQLQAL